MDVNMIVTVLMVKASQRSFGKSGAAGSSRRTLDVSKRCDGGIHAWTISDRLKNDVRRLQFLCQDWPMGRYWASQRSSNAQARTFEMSTTSMRLIEMT